MEEKHTSPPTVAIAPEGAIMRIYLGKRLMKFKVVCLVDYILCVGGVYLGFADIDWVRLCIFSDEGARRLLLPH